MKAMDAGQRTGLTVLAALVVAASTWIAVQGRHATATEAAVPTLIETPGLARFRADAWYLPNEPLLGFVAIPAGSFLMGSDPNTDHTAFENERWSAKSFQGRVDLPGYYMARYETTVAQFRAFVAATGYKADASAFSSAPDYPVTHVSWTDALAYSRWLTTTLQQANQTAPQLKQLLNEGWRFTLPDEAQWEKAARSGDGRIFPWGNSTAERYANFGVSTPASVGSIPCAACAFGLADMSGNVWELTRSPFQPYPFDAEKHGDLQTDALFVMRGGSYTDSQQMVRAAVRGGVDPGARREFIGFRLVLTPSREKS